MQLSKVVDQLKQASALQQHPQDVHKFTKQEVESAWRLLCRNGSTMSRNEAEYWLKLFYPDMPAKHLKELSKEGISLDSLQELLVEQPIEAVDPAAQALKVFDPQLTGAVDMSRLQDIMQQLHKTGTFSEQDMTTLLQVADLDMDGKIGLQDLHQFMSRIQSSISSTGASSTAAAAPAASSTSTATAGVGTNR